MLEKLLRLLGYEKIQFQAEEQPEIETSEPTIDEHIATIASYHNANFNKIEQAISNTHFDLKQLIASGGSTESEETLLRLNTLMLGIWCESRLHKLVYERDLFSESERKSIYSANSLEDKWKKSLEVALRRSKGLNADTPLDIDSLGFQLFQVYSQVKNWIDIHFSPIIKLRNKVAHSQWVNPFKNYQSGWDSSWDFKLCGETKGLLNKENVLTLEYKHELLKRIATAINNLSLTNTEYGVQDFDSMYDSISETAGKLTVLKNRDVMQFKSRLVERYNYQQEQRKTAQENTIINKLKLQFDLVPK
ncbi:hypothetical protein KW463_08535 [Vibrio fluvialis]|nr:hypothetical protein [Vibrio fluvialis]